MNIYFLKLVLECETEHTPRHEVDSWGILGGLDTDDSDIIRESRITRAVTSALWRKQINGAKEHGHVMNPFDGRVDALTEAFQEALDLTQYLMKMRLELGTAYPKAYDTMSEFKQDRGG